VESALGVCLRSVILYPIMGAPGCTAMKIESLVKASRRPAKLACVQVHSRTSASGTTTSACGQNFQIETPMTTITASTGMNLSETREVMPERSMPADGAAAFAAAAISSAVGSLGGSRISMPTSFSAARSSSVSTFSGFLVIVRRG
jgi:hypothetical protein